MGDSICIAGSPEGECLLPAQAPVHCHYCVEGARPCAAAQPTSEKPRLMRVSCIFHRA